MVQKTPTASILERSDNFRCVAKMMQKPGYQCHIHVVAALNAHVRLLPVNSLWSLVLKEML